MSSEESARSTFHFGLSLDPDGISSWNWRGPCRSGGGFESVNLKSDKVISVNLVECTKNISIDGSSDAIKDAIKAVFGLRSKRAFWLEDENGIVHSIDRQMPLRNYTLHLDEGVTIMICFEDPNFVPCHIIEKTFYSEGDLYNFLCMHCWASLRGLRSNKQVDALDDLEPGAEPQWD